MGTGETAAAIREFRAVKRAADERSRQLLEELEKVQAVLERTQKKGKAALQKSQRLAGFSDHLAQSRNISAFESSYVKDCFALGEKTAPKGFFPGAAPPRAVFAKRRGAAPQTEVESAQRVRASGERGDAGPFRPSSSSLNLALRAGFPLQSSQFAPSRLSETELRETGSFLPASPARAGPAPAAGLSFQSPFRSAFSSQLSAADSVWADLAAPL